MMRGRRTARPLASSSGWTSSSSSGCGRRTRRCSRRSASIPGRGRSCRAGSAVFAVKGGAEVVVAALRPSYLARIVPAPEFARLAAQVEADLMAVLEELAGE